jgi:hypothetical protein
MMPFAQRMWARVCRRFSCVRVQTSLREPEGLKGGCETECSNTPGHAFGSREFDRITACVACGTGSEARSHQPQTGDTECWTCGANITRATRTMNAAAAYNIELEV